MRVIHMSINPLSNFNTPASELVQRLRDEEFNLNGEDFNLLNENELLKLGTGELEKYFRGLKSCYSRIVENLKRVIEQAGGHITAGEADGAKPKKRYSSFIMDGIIHKILRKKSSIKDLYSEE